jgi:hypothetical protein
MWTEAFACVLSMLRLSILKPVLWQKRASMAREISGGVIVLGGLA